MQSLQIFHNEREEIPRLGYFPLPSSHKILGFRLDSTSLAANRLTASRYGRENTWSGACGRPHTNTHPTKSYLTLSDVQIADGLIFHTEGSNWWLCHESGYRLSQGRAMKGWEAEEQEKMKGSETNPFCRPARTNAVEKQEHLAAILQWRLFS